MHPKAAQIYGRSFRTARDPVRPTGLTIFLFAYLQKATSFFEMVTVDGSSAVSLSLSL